MRRRGKYNNEPRACNHGHLHASIKEAARCNELHMLQRTGQITGLEQQPVYPITIEGVQVAKYVADFAYFENGKRIVEDVKGVRTPVYRLKKRIVEALYTGVKIREV